MSGILGGVPFVRARSSNYATGRQGYQPLWFVVHATDTEYADNYPANLGKYWSSTDTQVSVHFAVSDTMTYQYVDCDDTAYQCRNPGNLRGIGVEMVGKSDWSRNEWLAHKRMFRRAAQLCAEVSAQYGLKVGLELLNPTQLTKRASGLSCHKDMSTVFQGTHTDPGPNFPWDFFFSELRIALAPVEAGRAIANATAAADAATTAMNGGDMSDADIALIKTILNRLSQQGDRTDAVLSGGGQGYTDSNLARQLGYVIKALGEKVDNLAAKVDALAKAPAPAQTPAANVPTQKPS